MPFVLLAVALLTVGVTAAIALGWVRGGLADPRPSRPDAALPPGRLTTGDVAGVRFAVAARGYRMDEVDDFIDRVLAELRAHQVEVAELRADQGRSVPAMTPSPSAATGPPADGARPVPAATPEPAAATESPARPVPGGEAVP